MPIQQWSSMDAARRRREIAQMEACDVPRVSRNGNLRAAFQAGQSQEAGTVAPSFAAPQYVAAGKTKFPPVVPLPSTPINQPSGRHNSVVIEQPQRYNTERLRPVPSRSFRNTESIPTLWARKPVNESVISEEHTWNNISAEFRSTFSNEQVQPLSSSSDSEDTTVEPDSTLIVYENRVTQNQELRRRLRDSSSSYAPSIHMTVNKPVLQHGHTQRSQAPNEEDHFPFDGGRNAREYMDYVKRSSYYSEFEERPDPSANIVPDPPVVRKAASWVADKLQSRADQVAGAVGLRPIVKIQDECRDVYCKLNYKNFGKKD